MLAGLKHGGATSLVSKRRGRPSNNRLPEAYRDLRCCWCANVSDFFRHLPPRQRANIGSPDVAGLRVGAHFLQLLPRRIKIAVKDFIAKLAAEFEMVPFVLAERTGKMRYD